MSDNGGIRKNELILRNEYESSLNELQFRLLFKLTTRNDRRDVEPRNY